MNEEQARKHVNELKGFYAHLGVYIGVNGFLLMINLMESGDELWFIYPLFGWGIGLVAHAFQVFGGGHGWEHRKMQELTGHSVTRDELERLTERTDALIKILGAVDWDQIDPDPLATRTNLQQARTEMQRMQRREGDAAIDEDQVRREIEKLEEFVTSPQFDYYDKASR
jgi:hypothetical protein